METDQVVGKRNIPKGKGAGCVAPVREEGRAGGRGPEMWAEGRGGRWQKVGSGEEGRKLCRSHRDCTQQYNDVVRLSPAVSEGAHDVTAFFSTRGSSISFRIAHILIKDHQDT